MRQLKIVFIISFLFVIISNSFSQKSGQRSLSVVATFVGSTPCSQGTRPLPGIPANAECELIKWNLTLYEDEFNKIPATYKLHCSYGLPQQGTTGLTGGGKKFEMEGKCTVIKGTGANPDATVYRLNDNKTSKTISFLKLNDHLLHLLDSDQHLMIGSAAWSYTLNRTSSK